MFRHPLMVNKRIRLNILNKIYNKLFEQFGPQHWWPGETAFEVIVGAILTQNTNWGNVEKAIANLKREKLLSIPALHGISRTRLAQAIKPAGYFNVKAERLKNVVGFLIERYNGDLAVMKRQPMDVLRRELLSVNGVGPETADSILLYALGKPVFVVDAYTKRFLRRHNLIEEGATYDEVQKLFADHLEKDVRLFNEYHALIVRLGKDFCKPSPRCEECLLKNVHYNRNNACRHCHREFLINERAYTVSLEKDRKICGDCRLLLKFKN